MIAASFPVRFQALAGCALVCCTLWLLGFSETASAAFGLEKSFPISEPMSEPGRRAVLWDLAVGPDRSIYVALGAEIQRYRRDGRLLNRWGGYGTAPGKFGSWFGAQSLAVDPAGSVYAYDYDNDRIQKFTAAGQFIRSIPRAGAPGTERDPFKTPGLATDRQGNLFVADIRGTRKLSPTGALLASQSLASSFISAGRAGLYAGGAVLALLDPFTLAYERTIISVDLFDRCHRQAFGCYGSNDISAARSGVWADVGDLVLFSPSSEVLQICDRVGGGVPAADGTAVYSYLVAPMRIARYGPNASARRACDSLAQTLTGVRVRGRTLRYRLSEPGRISVRLQSPRRGRYRTVRRISFPSRQGARRKRVLSRRRAATLARGRYRLVVRAIDEAGNRTRPQRRTLRLR